MPKNINGEKIFKIFNWRFKSEEDANSFEVFRMILLTKFSSVELKLMNWINSYVETHPLDFTVCMEPAAVIKLELDGLKTTRPTLKKYRELGVLIDECGNPFWFTDGHNIAYNYDLLKEFVKKRKSLGVTKIIQ